MNDMRQSELKARYNAAVNSFIDKVKNDPGVIAVIVCGSVAYDVVWEKSDIDMTVVVRDQNLKNTSYCIIEDGILINTKIITRSEFKRGIEKSTGGLFLQSYIAKGKMVYSTDDSLYEYFDDIKNIGSDDIALSALFLACEIIDEYNKCRKWLYFRKDPLYAQYYLLKSVEFISFMELCLNGIPSSREAIQKAIELNPDLILPLYHDLMSHNLSKEEIENRIEKIDRYLENCMDTFKKPIIEFMSDGEIKTVTLISNHFHTDGHFLINVLEYLEEKGVIEKASQIIRLTPKGKLALEEIGFLYIQQ